jgi:hypothetical protein
MRDEKKEITGISIKQPIGSILAILSLMASGYWMVMNDIRLLYGIITLAMGTALSRSKRASAIYSKMFAKLGQNSLSIFSD